MIKLSLIVPIYNVENYLRKCVDSLLHQDYEDYEIILVDDGSTDGSGLLADQLASRLSPLASSPTIQVIHQENRGLSGARNTGIEAAQGEYICFVDSDDYWEPNVLGELMEQIERDNLDVLRFQYRYVNEKDEEILPYKSTKKYTDYSIEVTNGENFLNNRLGLACYAWQFILKRELLICNNGASKGNSCMFTEGIYFEDTDWTPRMLMRVKRVASIDTMVYNYLWRVGSISKAVDMDKKRKVLEDKIKLLYGFMEQRKMIQDDSWYQWQVAVGTLSILGIIAEDFYAERKKYIREIQKIGVFPLSSYRLSRNFFIKNLVANFSPNLYCRYFSRMSKR